MKPLIHYLEENYTVVTLDYLGTSSSDNYHSKRTLENITGEIHEVMELLGYTYYTIVAVAYAGLYSLYYSNRYTDEVRTIVGIDAFAAEQNNNETYRENVRFTDYVWRDFHKSRIVQWIVEKAAKHYLKRAKTYVYDAKDMESYALSAACMLENIQLLDDYKCDDENFKELENVRFPEHIPVLFILSNHRRRKISGWYDMHCRLPTNSNSKIILSSGGRNLHITQAKYLAEEINAFCCCK